MYRRSRSLKHDESLSAYFRYDGSLYSSDGIILYKDNTNEALSLRPCVVNNIHSAHQDLKSMHARAQQIVFWSKITHEIESIQEKYRSCNQNFPFQPSLPQELSDPPTIPFEETFASFSKFAEKKFLVVGDRLSGWAEIFLTLSGTSKAGSCGLFKCLRGLFSRYGLPDDISSDGGPNVLSNT